MKRYNPAEIEKKWQQQWESDGTYSVDFDSTKPKYVGFGMFNYPSGAGIHVGHVRNYTIPDVVTRAKRQQGFASYQPVGWDSFGLPAENFAIKTGVRPQVSTVQAIDKYHDQYRALGWAVDWRKEISTTDPKYYRWTQWTFTKLFERGLAYQQESPQWWCDQCKTVLADEQVIAGKCWRHDGADDPLVTKKQLKQWFFKITDYADDLLDATDALDWTPSVKASQKAWIGRSVGAEIEFALANSVAVSGKQEAVSDVKGEARDTRHETRPVMDTLKFTPELTKMILDGTKTCTIRLEPKDVVVGDEVAFMTRDGEIVTTFGSARITQIRQMKLGDIPNDLPGHEPMQDDARKLKKYKAYYNDNITLETEFTIYDFEFLPKSKIQNPKSTATAITVFTTRPDTLFGATFLVVAPEHPLVARVTTDEQRTAVDNYVEQTLRKSEIQRQQDADKEKTGVFTGAYAVNPINNAQIPIWIADYVLMGYGTGAIMAVPGHDERDYAFASKFDLPITYVVEPTAGESQGDDSHKDSIFVVVRDSAAQKVIVLDWGPRKERHGGHMLIGGGVEGDEDPIEAAKREIKEETGYTNVTFVAKSDFKGHGYFYSNTKNKNMHVSGYGLLFDLVDDTRVGTTLDEGEKDKFTVTWQPIDVVAAMLDDKIHETMYRHLILGECYHDEGVLTNSGAFDGIDTAEARELIVQHLAREGKATEKINYKMRDWLISRQRYWGAPIPIVHCPTHGAVAVPEDQLPVELPLIDNYQPTGGNASVLAGVEEWVNTTCPTCGGPATRETDTMDGYVCSSWYFLRYLDPTNDQQAWDVKRLEHWMPIDFYNGGDHATAHLLYARFYTRFFHSLGLVPTPEPFTKMVFNGKVRAHDGSMFSKSKGNGIDPLEVIEQGYGADALRLYEMFAAPVELDVLWDPQGIPGTYRFISRVWNLVQEFVSSDLKSTIQNPQSTAIVRAVHQAIKKVTNDIEEHKFNTAIASLMELTNALYKAKPVSASDDWRFAVESLLQLLAPFAPHVSEELWHQLGHDDSIHVDHWPVWDEQYLTHDTMTLAVQVNGKLRAEISVATDASNDDIESAALAHERVQEYVGGKKPTRVIYVPGRLVNVVC